MNKTIAYIYHNPRCSKSRAALQILQDNNIDYQIIDYLNSPLTIEELKELKRKLNINAELLVRKNEGIYREKFTENLPSEVELLQAITSNPILLERPIVIYGERAVIGRPPERVLEILETK
jgi:arsenate reductase